MKAKKVKTDSPPVKGVDIPPDFYLAAQMGYLGRIKLGDRYRVIQRTSPGYWNVYRWGLRPVQVRAYLYPPDVSLRNIDARRELMKFAGQAYREQVNRIPLGLTWLAWCNSTPTTRQRLVAGPSTEDPFQRVNVDKQFGGIWQWILAVLLADPGNETAERRFSTLYIRALGFDDFWPVPFLLTDCANAIIAQPPLAAAFEAELSRVQSQVFPKYPPAAPWDLFPQFRKNPGI